MMTPEVAQLAGQFLQRVTLQPSEIDAFQTVLQVLGEIVRNASEPEAQSESPDE